MAVSNSVISDDQKIIFGWVLLIFSIGLYFFDWSYRFNGLEIQIIRDFDLFKGSVLFLTLIFTAVQILLTGEKTKEDWGSMVFVSLIFASVFILGKYNQVIVYHLLLALLVWIFLKKIDGMSIREANTHIAILLLADLFLFSLIESAALYAGQELFAAQIAYRVIFPIFPLYLMFYLAGKGNLMAFIMTIAVISIWIFGFIQTSELYQQEVLRISGEQKEATLDTISKGISGTKEAWLALWDPWHCKQYISDSNAYDDCLRELQIARECRLKGYEVGSLDYNDCLKERLEGGGTASGEADVEIIYPTKVEFKIQDYKVSANDKEKVDTEIQLESINNPIDIATSCSLEKSGQEIAAEITTGSFFNDVEGIRSLKVECQPEEDFKIGRYRIEFAAEIQGITTESTRQKIWVEEGMTEKEITKTLQSHKISAVETKSKNEDEFAALAISIGSDQTVLENDQNTQLIIGKLQNRKNGKIVGIQDITIELPKGVKPTQDCFERLEETKLGLKVKKDVISSKIQAATKLKTNQLLKIFSCNLDVSGLVYPQDHEKREFASLITYDYKITKKADIEAI